MNLLNLRKRLGLTQQQVADKMNIDIRNFRRIERGETFPARNIIPLAKALDVTLAQLYSFEHLALDKTDLKNFIIILFITNLGMYFRPQFHPMRRG